MELAVHPKRRSVRRRNIKFTLISGWIAAAACFVPTMLRPPGHSTAAFLAAPSSHALPDPAILRVQGNDPKAMARQAFELIDEGRYDEAQTLLDQALNIINSRGGNSSLARALRKSKATILTRTGQFEQARVQTQGDHLGNRGRRGTRLGIQRVALGERLENST